MNNNLKLWKTVEKTNPEHTKACGFGARKFTAIDAQYQFMNATEQFGPFGVGWGVDSENYIINKLEEDYFLFYTARLWSKLGDDNGLIYLSSSMIINPKTKAGIEIIIPSITAKTKKQIKIKIGKNGKNGALNGRSNSFLFLLNFTAA